MGSQHVPANSIQGCAALAGISGHPAVSTAIMVSVVTMAADGMSSAAELTAPYAPAIAHSSHFDCPLRRGPIVVRLEEMT